MFKTMPRWLGGDGAWLRRAIALVLALLLAVVLAWVLVERAGPSGPMARPALQRILKTLVTGSHPLAPGVTAYVSGPHGAWIGAAGVANLKTGERMWPDARMRLESVSKIYTATLVILLHQAGKLQLSDTVARWLPGLLPYGSKITIRELLTMRSGLVSDNDFAGPAALSRGLANVKDSRLRSELAAVARRATKDPATQFSPILWIKFAAWQPLLFTPGTSFRYTNIGYDILGLIASRAGGAPLATLYQRLIFRPLGLRATTYEPQGPIAGRHANGYGISHDGASTDATNWHPGIGAGGGIISSARDTATFLTDLMRGTLLGRQYVAGLRGDDLWRGGEDSGCAGHAYGWSGGGWGYKTNVWVNADGTRVAVLLLNARHWGSDQAASDQAAGNAMARLYCRAS